MLIRNISTHIITHKIENVIGFPSFEISGSSVVKSAILFTKLIPGCSPIYFFSFVYEHSRKVKVLTRSQSSSKTYSLSARNESRAARIVIKYASVLWLYILVTLSALIHSPHLSPNNIMLSLSLTSSICALKLSS